jgi:hypothetical protein
MQRLTLIFLLLLGLLTSLPAEDSNTQIRQKDGSWWVYYILPAGQGHGGVLIVSYKYTVTKTGKTVKETKEVPEGQGVLVRKVTEVTKPVVTGSENKVLMTDPAHAK